MFSLIVVDVQNEFSADGERTVPDHASALARIQMQVHEARNSGVPIAWVKHHNRPDESPAFVPGSWGAELSLGLGPQDGNGREKLFTKEVFGAFTGTGLEEWLRMQSVSQVVVVGFFTHMCVSTTCREALVRGFEVFVDPEATGAHDLEDSALGKQSAEEVRRSALLQLRDMGVKIADHVISSAHASFSEEAL